MIARLVGPLLVLVLALAGVSPTLVAQEPKNDAAPAAADQEPPAPPPAMETPASVPGQDAPSGPPAKSAAPVAQPRQTPPAEKNFAVWAIQASGPIGAVLFIMSFLAVGLTVKFVLEMQHKKVIPPQLIAEFETKIKEKKFQEAYQSAKNSPSFLGRVLAAGLAKLSTGYAQAVEAMHEVGEDESMRLEHRLSWLAILGTTGPLLGLVGTVYGIIKSFQVIATSETQPKPNQLAEGISTSLFNTFEGLLVAIIATIAFMLLKNHAARLVLEVGMVSGNLMTQLSNLVRPARSASGASASAGQGDH